NPNYSVTPTDSSLTVGAKAASVLANAKSKTYGSANPVLDAVVTGTVNGDILAFSLATTATTTSGVGTYPITVSLGTNANYSLVSSNSLLSVIAKTATVVANSKSKTYGDVNPVLDAAVTGTVNGDTLAYTLATTATTNSAVGAYPVTVTLGSNPNYVVARTNGLLTIIAKPLVVTANNQTKVVGAADPVFGATYAGFVNGETSSVLAGTLVFSRAPGETAGSYAITPSGLSSVNYAITFVAGTLSITPGVSTPVVLSITRSGASGISIRWPSIANKTYRVQTSSGLNSGIWTDLPGDVVATGTTAEKIDSISSGLRFYRVQVLP
ncbi:MAG: MBG domain-containing protein, partial [Verrucomicrobiota bacterium]